MLGVRSVDSSNLLNEAAYFSTGLYTFSQHSRAEIEWRHLLKKELQVETRAVLFEVRAQQISPSDYISLATSCHALRRRFGKLDYFQQQSTVDLCVSHDQRYCFHLLPLLRTRSSLRRSGQNRLSATCNALFTSQEGPNLFWSPCLWMPLDLVRRVRKGRPCTSTFLRIPELFTRTTQAMLRV